MSMICACVFMICACVCMLCLWISKTCVCVFIVVVVAVVFSAAVAVEPQLTCLTFGLSRVKAEPVEL